MPAIAEPAIIPDKKDTEKKTLKKQTETIDEVIVVDNSPNNLSAEIFKNCYPQAVIYKQQVNLDFCRGYNFGLQKSHGDYLLILNQN